MVASVSTNIVRLLAWRTNPTLHEGKWIGRQSTAPALRRVAKVEDLERLSSAVATSQAAGVLLRLHLRWRPLPTRSNSGTKGTEICPSSPQRSGLERRIILLAPAQAGLTDQCSAAY